MTFFELSRVNIYVSIAGLGLWPALADNTYITLDYITNFIQWMFIIVSVAMQLCSWLQWKQ